MAEFVGNGLKLHLNTLTELIKVLSYMDEKHASNIIVLKIGT